MFQMKQSQKLIAPFFQKSYFYNSAFAIYSLLLLAFMFKVLFGQRNPHLHAVKTVIRIPFTVENKDKTKKNKARKRKEHNGVEQKR